MPTLKNNNCRSQAPMQGSQLFVSVNVSKVAKIRDGYNQVPHLTQDTTWENDKNTIKHHKREPRGLLTTSNAQTRKHDKDKT